MDLIICVMSSFSSN